MLFTINKNKSMVILQVGIALFLVLAPVLIGILPGFSAVYMLFLFSALLFSVRFSGTGRIHSSLLQLIATVLFIYTFVSSIWADNREGQLCYLFLQGGAVLFFSSVVDYFKEGNAENVKRRIMYLLLSGGLVCAIVNICYWLIYIIPVAGKEAFSLGMGSNDFLGVFMLVCIICICCLFKENTASRRKILGIAVFPVAFVLIMTKSPLSLIMGGLLLAVFLTKKKSEKLFVPAATVSAVIFTWITGTILSKLPEGKVFADLFSYALAHPFGVGGGAMSAQSLFTVESYPVNSGVGMLPMVFAQSGIIGFLCCTIVIARVIMLLIRRGTWESLIGALITAMVMLLPVRDGYSVIFLWTGLLAYNEQEAGHSFTKTMKRGTTDKSIYILALICVLATVFTVQAFIKQGGECEYKEGDYLSAYSIYRACAAINITDSDSCRRAAMSLRKSGDIKMQRDEAIALIDKAIKRDSSNLENIAEKGRIYYACEEYDMAAQQYRVAAQRAMAPDKYNQLLAKTLYKIVKKNPKGSSETKRAYAEILQIAQKTQDLDRKKEINDIADKALVYTKEELKSE